MSSTQITPYYAELEPYLKGRWYSQPLRLSVGSSRSREDLRAEVARTRAAFLEYLQEENQCHLGAEGLGKPCAEDCACQRQMQRAIAGAYP